MTGKILDKSFYTRADVTEVAKDLLGKLLVTNFDNKLTSGIITETEAYDGITDKASHAYGNRRTKRTEVMYQEGGIAYIYLCYGIHSLFNVVTNQEDIPQAILVRSIIPYHGNKVMLNRIGKNKFGPNPGYGPGRVSMLLGIHYSMSGMSLSAKKKNIKSCIWIEDIGILSKSLEIESTPRIGVDYADEDAKLPYRYTIKNPDIIYQGFSI
jgi:DNA-3-methyladenine glycosylase